MECVGAGLGHVVDLRAGLAAILAGVTVDDHGRFRNLICAQRQIAGAGVVQVEVRVHVVGAVDREQVRNARQAERREVAVSAAGADRDAGSRERIGCHVIAGRGQIFKLERVVGGRQVGVFVLQQTARFGYRHDLGLRLQSKLDVHARRPGPGWL